MPFALTRVLNRGEFRGIALVCGLAAVAAATRMALLNAVPFTYDDATVATAARQMIESHRLVQTGMQSSAGPLNPPLFDYLMAVPFAFTRNPRAGILFTALCNVAGVLVTYAVGRRAWGVRAGAIAGGLFAVAPWAAVYSRGIWAPDLEPPLAACCLYALLRAYQDDGRWLAMAIAAWLWMCQLHPDAALLAPVFVLAFPLLRKRLRRRAIALGAVVGLLPLVPYVANDAANHWENLRKYLIAAGHPYQLDLTSLRLAVMDVTSLGTAQLSGVPYAQFTPGNWGAALAGFSLIASVVLGLAVLTAVGACIVGLRRGAPPSPATFLLLIAVSWWCVPIILTLRHDEPLYQHYLLILFPAPFLLLGYAINLLGWSAGKRPLAAPIGRLRVASAAMVTLTLVGGWLVLLTSYYLHVASVRAHLGPDLALETLEHVAALAQRSPTARLQGVFPDKGVRIPVAYLFDMPQEALDGPPDALILPPPGQDAAYLFDDASRPAALALMQARIPSTGRVSYLDRQHTAIGFLWSANQRADAITATLQPLPIRLANGVQFLGYGLSWPQTATVRIAYVWRVDRVDAATRASDPALYTHLLDTAGRMVGQHDGMPIPATEWQPGETIASWFDISLTNIPPGRYDLRFGMYSRPSITRIPTLDFAGKPAASDFPLTSVTIGGSSD